MADKKFKKVKVSTPVSLIVHGGNLLGYSLAKTIIEQGGRAIIVDQYTAQSKKYVTELKKLGQADFIDFNGLENLYKTIGRVDYVFYLLSDQLPAQEKFTSKDFLEESNYLNSTLKTAQKHNAKVALVTTMLLNQQLSAHILNTNMASPSPYSAIELQKYCETLTAEHRDKSNLNTRILRLGTVLGEGVEKVSDPVIAEILDESITKSTISIKGEGLDLHYLININDAVYGILKLTFSDDTEGEVISLANNHDYTTLSVAYKLLEVNPETAEIKFVQNPSQKKLSLDNYAPAPNAEEFGWAQKSTIEQSMIETIATIYPRTGKSLLERPKNQKKAVEEKIKAVEKGPLTVKTPLGKALESVASPFTKGSRRFADSWARFRQSLNPVNTSIYVLILIFSLLTLYFLVLPIVSVAAGGYLSYRNAQLAYTDATKLNFDDASSKLERSNEYIRETTKGFNNLKWAFDLLNQEELFNNSSQLLFGAQYATAGAADLSSSLMPLATYVKDFEPAIDFQNNLPTTGREYRDHLKSLEDNAPAIERATYNIELASNLVGNVDPAVFPNFVQDEIVWLKERNSDLAEQLEPASKLATFLPQILGLDERARYVVLLQNSAEIRSTGGWLSSYAVIALENGQIRELSVDDIYNADGQLKLQDKEYTAPQSLQTALDIETWLFSYSNWNPDLSETADAVEFFVRELDPGTRVDGVITIDTEFMKELLRKWEGIEVPGEEQLVTAENLDQKIYDIHSEFTPGSSVKATFLANLANETVKRLLSGDLSSYGEIGDVFIKSLNEKHLLVYMKQREALDYFSSKGWSGLLDPSYADTPIVVDWNWGGNKANAFLTKNHNLTLDITDAENIRYTYSQAVQNNSATKIYPQGDYENYMRIYLPEYAKVETTEGFLNDEFDTYEENGYKVVGGWFNVPVNSTKVFEITYTVTKQEEAAFPIAVSDNNITANLNIYKQPGTLEDSLKLDITYPDAWAAVEHEGLTRGINRLSVQTKLETDREFDAIWQFK